MGTHNHCWHVTGGYSNGMDTAGEDVSICCHCGLVRTRKWRTGIDAGHGVYSPTRIKIYEDAVEKPVEAHP